MSLSMPLSSLVALMLTCCCASAQNAGKPTPTILISGDNVTMECNRTVEGTVDWKVNYDPSGTLGYICNKGRLTDKYKPRFELDPNSYTLTIHDVMVSDSGLYYCIDDEGAGQVHFTQLEVVLPAPRLMKLMNRTVDELTLSWFQDGVASGYNVSINGVRTTNVTYSDTRQTGTVTARIYSLLPGTGYNVSVWSTRGDAQSKNSTVSYYATVPAAPEQLRLVNRTDRCLVISWNQRGRATSYQLTVDDSCALNTEYFDVGTELASARLCCLSIGTRYKITIRAFSGNDQSQEIADYFETEPRPTEPPAPVILHVVVILCSVSAAVLIVAVVVTVLVVRRFQRVQKFESSYKPWEVNEAVSSQRLRKKMVDNLITKSNMKTMISKSVLDVMKIVPRHVFLEKTCLPSFTGLSDLSEQDIVDAYVYNNSIGATPSSRESSPEIIGAQLSVASILPGQSVLLVGIKGGYIQVLVAQLVGKHGSVVTATSDGETMEICRRRVEQYCPLAKIVKWVVVTDVTNDTSVVEEIQRHNLLFHHVIYCGSVRVFPNNMKDVLYATGSSCIIAPVKSESGDNGQQFQLYHRLENGVWIETTINKLGVLFGGIT